MQRCSLHLMEHTELVGKNHCYKLHSGSIISGQTDRSIGTQNSPSYFFNQSMGRIISMPLESMMMRFDRKSTPLMAILIAGHICLVFISPPGELTSIVYFMMVIGRLCFATNFDDMKECDAPGSNKIVARCEFVWNIPNTTCWDCGASLTVT
jgi:hypothetical protein